MDQILSIGIINNAALLLALSGVNEISYYIPKRFVRYKSIITGILISFICLIIMSVPFTIKPGLFYDTRSILISVAALIFGVIPTLIVSAVAIVYRIMIGGVGTLAGVSVIISSALIGLAWKRWLYPKRKYLRWLNVYAMSITVHSTMLLCMFFLPYPDSINIIRAIGMPVMLVYPVASILLGLFIIRQIEHHENEEKLRASEEKYRRLFETMVQGVVYQAADGGIISANPAAERILGLTYNEMLGKTSMDPEWETILEDGTDLPGYKHPAMVALQTGKPVGPFIMGVYQPLLNDHIWISVNAIPLFQEGEQKPHQVYVTMTDITAEKKADLNYQLLFEKMVDAFALHEIVCDENGRPLNYRYLAVNPVFENMTGLTADEIIGKTVLEVLPETELYWIEKYGQVALTGIPIEFENYSANLDKHFHVNAYRPAPNQFASIFSDITDRVRSEQALKESEMKYSSYIENAPDGIFVVDEKGRYIEMNPAALNMTGYTNDELLNMSIADITPREEIESALMNFAKLQKTGYISLEQQFIRKDKSVRWWTVDAVKLSENRYLGFCGDITDKKKAEDMLIYANAHDSLTDLYNRRHFDEEIERLDKSDVCPLSVLIGDINGLKLINDAFGRREGDRIIVNTAKLFKENSNPDYIVSRTGGDEFSIIMPGADKETAYELMKKIQCACESYNKSVINEAFRISISMGCGTKTDMTDNSKNMLKIAEQYLSQRKLLENKSSHNAILSSIKATMIEKSHETESHAERLVVLTRPVGLALNLSQVEMDHLELLATLHDIGKVGISDLILNKSDDLTSDEWIEMKKHPEAGYRITLASLEFAPIADYILNHHERWDGEGYPQGISGEDIPLLSRIIAVADSYDAMTKERPYRKAMTHKEALEEVVRCSGTQFDPHIVKIFYDAMTKS